MEEETELGEISGELCLIVVLFLIIGFILLIYFTNRKIPLASLPHENTNLLLEKMDFLFRSQGWETKMNPSLEKIKVSKDFIVAADIYLKDDQNGDLKAVSGSTTSDKGWALVFVLFFMTGGIGFIIFIIIIHIMSRKFTKNELKPLLENHSF